MITRIMSEKTRFRVGPKEAGMAKRYGTFIFNGDMYKAKAMAHGFLREKAPYSLANISNEGKFILSILSGVESRSVESYYPLEIFDLTGRKIDNLRGFEIETDNTGYADDVRRLIDEVSRDNWKIFDDDYKNVLCESAEKLTLNDLSFSVVFRVPIPRINDTRPRIDVNHTALYLGEFQGAVKSDIHPRHALRLIYSNYSAFEILHNLFAMEATELSQRLI